VPLSNRDSGASLQKAGMTSYRRIATALNGSRIPDRMRWTLARLKRSEPALESTRLRLLIIGHFASPNPRNAGEAAAFGRQAQIEAAGQFATSVLPVIASLQNAGVTSY